MTAAPAEPPRFDIARLYPRIGGHGHMGWLDIAYRDHGADWVELQMPFADRLVGDVARGVLASGAIVSLMDVAASCAVWQRLGRFAPQATLDLRLDYLRPSIPGRTVIGRGECYRLTRRIAFVRGVAHDGDPHDPVAHATGTFMFTDEA